MGKPDLSDFLNLNYLKFKHEEESQWCFGDTHHKYNVHDAQGQIVFTAEKVSKEPLTLFNSQQNPILQIHFENDFGFLGNKPAKISTFSPEGIPICSTIRETGTLFASSTFNLVDNSGKILLTILPLKQLLGENKHPVVREIDGVTCATILAKKDKSTLTISHADVSPEMRAMMISTAIWLEIIERKKAKQV